MKKEPSSYKDRSGFVFYEGGRVLRRINKCFEMDFELFFKSGLYENLWKTGKIVKHKKIKAGVVEVEKIPFISYPYEWCFSQLKAAALLTLAIEKEALAIGMNLKDASAYNVQFVGTRPVFIDTLSFEKHMEGRGWVAYRQFCRHFLAPLALMAKVDGRLERMQAEYLDGVPLDLAVRLLPKKSMINLGLLAHIYLNAESKKIKSQKKYKLSKQGLINLIDSLEATIKKLRLKRDNTEWGDYYSQTNYSKKAFEDKKFLVKKYLAKTRAKTVLDLGANTGEFGMIGAEMGAYTLSADLDFLAVEKNYKKWEGDEKILPLVLDITNPSAAVGWANEERKSFWQRAKVDTVLALALIHHLAISNNLPFEKIAKLMAGMTKFLIIEFVPKTDSKVKILLSQREDVFDNYSQKEFERVFGKYFEIEKAEKVEGSKRKIYLMRRK